jgi:dimethylargininase
MPIAYTRAVSPALPACVLTHLARAPIDIGRAMAQHAAYEQALADAGCTLRRLPDLPDAPDGVFVEDTAILLGQHAIIARPGATSRAAETASVSRALQADFTLHELAGGMLDGGDVLHIERTLFVGRSSRTDASGAASLAQLVEPLGLTVVPVEVRGCLHLKTAVTWLGDALLLNPDWIDLAPLAALPCLLVAPGEAWAANTLRIGETVHVSAGNPATTAQLRKRGYHVQEIDVSELQKAEAGLTCLSLITT